MNRICKFVQELSESRHGLLYILALSLIVKGWIFILHINAVVNTDGVYYISAAKQFAMGQMSEALAIYPMPCYPLLIAFVHVFVPHWTIAAKLSSYICLVLMTIPLYMLSRDLFDQRAAFWGCLVFALLPESMRFTLMVIRDPSFFLLFIWAVYFAQRALRSKRVIHVLATASLSCLSTLFRIEGIIIFPVYLLVLVTLGIVRPEQRRAFLRLAAIWVTFFVTLIIAAALVVGPQSLILSRYSEYVDHLQSSIRFGFRDNFNRISAQLGQMQEAAPYSQWGEQFASTARQFIGVIYLLGLLQMFIKVVLPVNIIPLIGGLRKSPVQERHVFVLMVALCYLVMVYSFFIHNDFLLSRFLFIPAVLACPWIGLGICFVLDFAKRQRFGGIISICIVGLLVLIPSNKFDKYFKKKDDLEVRAGSWLATQHDFEKLKIIFTDPKVAFYTGREICFRGNGDTILFDDMNDKDFTKIEQYAAGRQFDLIVVSVQLERRELLRDMKQYQEIREFTGRNRSVVVYRSLRHFKGD